jgi:hypothetical protein
VKGWEAWAAIAAAVVAAAAWARSWWRGRAAARDLAAERARAERAELERDAAGGRAAVAEAEVTVLEEHATREAAGDAVATEVHDATASVDPADPGAVIGATDDWVRAHAGGAGPGAGGDPPAGVPRRR